MWDARLPFKESIVKSNIESKPYMVDTVPSEGIHQLGTGRNGFGFRGDAGYEIEVLVGRGELHDVSRSGWLRGVDGLELGGILLTSTYGGPLGEACIHSANGIADGVRQARGTAVNQVRDIERVLVTVGAGVPTSGPILGRE